MSELNQNEYAMLELLAMAPLSCLPPIHQQIVEQLLQQGLIVQHDDLWYPTALALKLVGHTVH